jgi:hypothetical protein
MTMLFFASDITSPENEKVLNQFFQKNHFFTLNDLYFVLRLLILEFF